MRNQVFQISEYLNKRRTNVSSNAIVAFGVFQCLEFGCSDRWLLEALRKTINCDAAGVELIWAAIDRMASNNICGEKSEIPVGQKMGLVMSWHSLTIPRPRFGHQIGM